ncbi:hypothetical protein HLH33_00535 [Gluconacetobacter diazotrophicus]|uniref:Uncharacterized protein n=1 Tax=Gluconacetobacter diazotrophicus TaxID=33996 RepID=A0A7W4FBV2_GLUDI|nr:hypothetical protein [Gluconacetobacter diazotrophicus]MBB2154807.1 hypothetical protein [Gluconacetobacter diazotrophicus]
MTTNSTTFDINQVIAKDDVDALAVFIEASGWAHEIDETIALRGTTATVTVVQTSTLDGHTVEVRAQFLSDIDPTDGGGIPREVTFDWRIDGAQIDLSSGTKIASYMNEAPPGFARFGAD